MMKVLITCINGLAGTAQYAQAMVSEIAHQLGFKNMGIFFIIQERKVIRA